MKKVVDLGQIGNHTYKLIKLPVKELMKLYIENDMKDPVIEISFDKNHCYECGTH